jgi:hypothetical protein
VKTGERWQFIGALTLAGALSLYASFLGLMGMLRGGFSKVVQVPYSLLLIAPLLAFPLFVLAAASVRPAAFFIWGLGPSYSLALFQVSARNYAGSFLHYLGLLLACLCDRIAIILWVTAWLVHFGTRIYAVPGTGQATIGS